MYVEIAAVIMSTELIGSDTLELNCLEQEQGHESDVQGDVMMDNGNCVKRKRSKVNNKSETESKRSTENNTCSNIQSNTVVAWHDCTDCGKTFKSRGNLRCHRNYAHRERVFHCEQCEFSARTRSHVKRHVEGVHKRVKRAVCELCEQSFSTSSSLAHHISTVHHRERRFKCYVCDSRFTQSSDLRRHLSNIHSGEKPFSCDMCSYRCCRKSELMKHQTRVHFYQVTKSFECKKCEFTTTDGCAYLGHMKQVHGSEKPYTCAECGKSFRETGYLNTHMKRVHAS